MFDKIPPIALTFDDVLLRPAASSVLPHEVSLGARLTQRLTMSMPLLSAAMDTVTEAQVAAVMARAGGVGVLHRNLEPDQQAEEARVVKAMKADGGFVDEQGRYRVAAAIGTSDRDLAERAPALIAAECDIIVVDTAHGHSRKVLDTVALLRERYPEQHLIAGNVATAEATRALIEAGADAIKVGVGPGSICTTRIVAGVGVPQLTAIGACAAEADKHDIPVIADGGIKRSGDIVKAIAAGASTVMIGSLFAGTDEAPGRRITEQGRSYKVYRGMGSIGAMVKGSSDRYFQADTSTEKLIPEGVEGRVPYRGPLGTVVHRLVGGLRAGMGYTGSPDIEALRQNGSFVRISPAGLRESHVHDIIVTNEEPV